MVAVMPSSVLVTVVGGWGGISAPGICAKVREEFRLDKKRKISIVADWLIRTGKADVVDIPVRLRLTGFPNLYEVPG
jgi:hypothetical protein